MNRVQFAEQLIELIRITNSADSDNPQESWTVPAHSHTICQPLLNALKVVLGTDDYEHWLETNELTERFLKTFG